MEVTRDQHVTSQTSQAPPTPLASPDAGVVFLNVGGRKFITRKETLQSRGPNFITALVEGSEEGKWKAARDEHGYIVIDRSGKIFERVLDFLRTGYLPPMSHPQRELVEVELDYFQIRRDPELELPPSGKGKHASEIKDTIASSAEKWRAKASAFVQAHGEYLLTKFFAELDQGYDTLKESYPAQNGQVNVGAESIALFRNTQSLYLRFISEIMSEQYGVIAKWKAFSSSLVLLIQYGPQHELVQDIHDMLEASFEPHGRRLRVHHSTQEAISTKKKNK